MSINDQDEPVVNRNMQEDDPSERNKGIGSESMEEGYDIKHEEQPYNVIKLFLLGGRTLKIKKRMKMTR